ncbi:hypothetical protein GNF53_03175 [Clostridium perfringens]|uniref:Uncharacterized protein n=2 Tax=Clostridium perfringens TaxID=1502 RepID=A0AAN5NAX6_CLOPF|nr:MULTISPECIES: hypothetical protein [Clostridium]ABG83614.1 hypothetical protein CPF_0567 [Clostridium perfringens ATCC 13124]AMN31966.1 hypothetical protein JFP55_03185 [Clostridium perfringens]AQW25880.1 hypothetical protein BXT94_03545 [Clostridium perfringens]EGT3619084.1 hypothetical protein [Clostridium perfringens]EJT6493152.1 hypothetical protein [Clostridium perfringens]
MLNKSDNEIYIMAPSEGNVLDYIVLNKAFNLEDLEEIISLNSHNEFLFSPIEGKVINISKDYGFIEIGMKEGVNIIVSTHINKNIKAIEPMVDIGGNVLTGQILMYFEKDNDCHMPITVAIKKSNLIKKSIKSTNRNININEYIMKLNLI